jgi:hypothetical protein
MDKPAPVNSQPRIEGAPDVQATTSHDPFANDEYVSLAGENDSFQGLDEIFSAPHRKVESAAATGLVVHDDPFVFEEPGVKDASSTVMGAGGLDDDFHSALDAFEAPEAPQVQVAVPSSPPKIVRSMPPSIPTPQAPILEEPFDPFAAMQDDEIPQSSSSPEQARVAGDDIEGMFGDLPGMEELPIVHSTPVGAPRIVRPGEGGTAHDRILVPPPAPQPVSHVSHVPEVSQAPKEADAMTEPRDRIYWKAESPLIGFLVTYDHDPKGSYVELRQGRLMVSNQREESGSCLVVLGESVSPMHAIMRVASGGIVQVLDQLSESGTRVKHLGQPEEEFLSGEKSSLSHGDIVFFGDRKFHVLLVVGEE